MITKLNALTKVEVGTKCVVNALPDTYVYVVKSVDEQGRCELEYKSGHNMVSGGVMPKFMLFKPTAEQLRNAGY